MRRLAAAIAAAAVALLALAFSARADDPEDTLVLKDGRVLKGRILEDGAEVTIKMPLGTLTFKREEVAEVRRADAEAPPAPAGEPDSSGDPEGDTFVVLDDGGTLAGPVVERGPFLEVATKEGPTLVARARVARIARGAEPPKAQAPAVHRDYALRFALAVPLDGWEVAREAGHPTARARMTLEAGRAQVEVEVAPFDNPDLQLVRAESLPFLRAALDEHLRAQYLWVRDLRVEVAEFQGAKAWRVGYKGAYRVFKDEEVVREVRFPSGRRYYTIRARCRAADAAELGPRLDAALEGFSFLGDTAREGGTYADVARGFLVSLPRPDWVFREDALSDGSPLEVVASGGVRAAVAIQPLPQGGDLAKLSAAEDEERRPASAHYKKLGERLERRDGVDALERVYQDAVDARLTVFREVWFIARGRELVRIAAGRPAVGETAARDETAIEELFQRVRLIAEPNLADFHAKGLLALDHRADGEKALDAGNGAEALAALDRAIAIAPAYARAYLVRGRARAATGDTRGALRDYLRADDLGAPADVGRFMGEALAGEALRLEKEPNLEGAIDALRKALRYDADNEKYLRQLEELLSRHARDALSAKEMGVGIQRYRKALEVLPRSKRLKDELTRAYQSYAAELVKQKDLYAARRELRRARTLDPSNTQVQAQLKSVEDEIARQAQPKPRPRRTR